jgi:hypothetical protein
MSKRRDGGDAGDDAGERVDAHIETNEDETECVVTITAVRGHLTPEQVCDALRDLSDTPSGLGTLDQPDSGLWN